MKRPLLRSQMKTPAERRRNPRRKSGQSRNATFNWNHFKGHQQLFVSQHTFCADSAAFGLFGSFSVHQVAVFRPLVLDVGGRNSSPPPADFLQQRRWLIRQLRHPDSSRNQSIRNKMGRNRQTLLWWRHLFFALYNVGGSENENAASDDPSRSALISLHVSRLEAASHRERQLLIFSSITGGPLVTI